MSVFASMTDLFQVRTRADEAEVTTMLQRDLPGHVETLSASGARRQSTMLEPDVTHVGRFPNSTHLVAGRRLRRQSDGLEWIVRVVRVHDKPRPGHTLATLVAVEPES